MPYPSIVIEDPEERREVVFLETCEHAAPTSHDRQRIGIGERSATQGSGIAIENLSQ